jgi:hypothetical protein
MKEKQSDSKRIQDRVCTRQNTSSPSNHAIGMANFKSPPPPPSPAKKKTSCIKGFGENISQLSLCINVSHLDVSIFNMVSQEVVSPLKVSHSFVEDLVFDYIDCTSVVAHEGNSLKDYSKVSLGVHNRIWEQQLHTQSLWWNEQLQIIFEKTSKQEKI